MPSSSQASRIPLVSGPRVQSEYSFCSAGDGLNRVGSPERLNARLRHPEMPDLALRDQFLDRSRDVLDRHIRIDPMLIEKVDRLNSEAFQRAFDSLPDALRPTGDAAVLAGLEVDVEAELGRNHHLIAHRCAEPRRRPPRSRTALALAAARDGLGVAYLPEDYARADIEAGRVIRALESWRPPFPGYHLYFPSRRQQTPAFALLVEALRYRA